MSDQPQAEAPVASPPTGFEDYFGDQPTEADVEQVTPSEAGTQPSEEPTEQKPSESTDDKKTTTTKDENGEDISKDKSDKDDSKDDAQPDKFEVAGRTYETYEEAVEAVNKINGHNTKLSGDVKSLTKEKIELETKMSELEGLLDKYQEANKQWQAFYESGEPEDKPKQSMEDIDRLVEQKVKQIKTQERDIERKTQFAVELDEIFENDDFVKVQPFFEELLNEFEGVPKANPKTLYKRAQALYKDSLSNGEMKDIDSINEMVEERVKKELAKREASKGNSASGGGGEPKTEQQVPPEVADYFAQLL